MTAGTFARTVARIMADLADMCEACITIAEPYLVRVDKHGLTAKYRCACGREWNCWWSSVMAPDVRELAARCCGSVPPYEIELDCGRARADWGCRCGRLWSYSDQAQQDDGRA